MRCAATSASRARSNDFFQHLEKLPISYYHGQRTGEFHGRYHVLLGAMSPLEGIGPEQLAAEKNVHFYRSADEAVDHVRRYTREGLLERALRDSERERGDTDAAGLEIGELIRGVIAHVHGGCELA